MFNSMCKNMIHPFGKECDKNWNVATYGYFAIDPSLSLDCDIKGVLYFIRI